MILAPLSFPIDFNAFNNFLVANVPDANGVVTCDAGYNIIEIVPFTQADIDAVNAYYNNLAPLPAPVHTNSYMVSAITTAIQQNPSALTTILTTKVLMTLPTLTPQQLQTLMTLLNLT